MRRKYLRLDPSDNVLVALDDLNAGVHAFEDREVNLPLDVPRKHKFLTVSLQKGEKVIMYGVPVATANEDLEVGSLLTIENITHFASNNSIEARQSYDWSSPDVSKWEERTFMGYHRKDGKVGTQNLWLFVPLVFCENRNLKVIEDALRRSLGYHKPNQYESYVQELLDGTPQIEEAMGSRVYENIDGIKFLYHSGGCGGTRQDSEALLRLLVGYVNHPNVAGATILSLGCQHAQISWFRDIQSEMFPDREKPVIYLEQQSMGSEEVLIKSALEQTLEALPKANDIKRKPAPLSKLVVGLECGGSDGFSGISANPAVGHTSDLVSTLGGATILSEFPELNGVEQNLVDRCETVPTAQKFIDLQQAYSDRAKAVGSGFDMNPSPGNIRDGLITDAIKSAGAAKKGGTAPVSDVLDYTEQVTKAGLNLLCTPGNDVESTTGLAGSGANVILFTTGLGTPTGNPITPVIKVSSNTDLANRMSDLIDLDAGAITEGDKTIEEVGEELLELIIRIASGEETKAMKLEQNDFIPWKRGVSL